MAAPFTCHVSNSDIHAATPTTLTFPPILLLLPGAHLDEMPAAGGWRCDECVARAAGDDEGGGGRRKRGN